MPLLKKIGLLIETETDNCDNENEKCYEPLASIFHLQFKDMNLLEEDDSNVTIEILKAKALATANNNSLRTTIKEEPQDNYDLQTSTQTDIETKQVACVKRQENSMRPNKRPCLNLLKVDFLFPVGNQENFIKISFL